MFSRHVVILLTMLFMVHTAMCGDAEEHRRIGNKSFKEALALNTEFRSLLQTHNITDIVCIIDGNGANDLSLTYGDVCALLSRRGADPLRVLRVFQRAAFAMNDGRLIVDKETQSLLRTQMSDSMHFEDFHHRTTPGCAYNVQLHKLDEPLAKRFLPVLLDREDQREATSFQTDTLNWKLPDTIPAHLTAPAMYALFHARSRALYLHAQSLMYKSEKSRFLLLAIITSALADHYLQDLFASDHHIADCAQSDGSILLADKDVNSLEQQGCRDFYRHIGIRFQFAQFDPSDILYGDGRFDTIQISRACRASVASIVDATSLDQPYHEYVDSIIQTIKSCPLASDQYCSALLYAPLPLADTRYEESRRLARSMRGPYLELSTHALTTGRTVGYTVDISAGIVFHASSLGLPRSRAAGYETVVSFVPSLSATYGFSRDAWFALLRGGIAIQLFDAVKLGVSFGPTFNAITASGGPVRVPTFIDANFVSKPLAYNIGLAFHISVAASRNAPYDIRIGFGIVWY